jgi:dipeptidyl-peptidase-4
MGLLEDNPQGYATSSAVENAAKLGGRLLLVHSMMDDNVHPINTMQFLTALTKAGRDVDLRIFPPGAHGAAYDATSLMLMYRTYFQFLEQHLKRRGPSAGVSF